MKPIHFLILWFSFLTVLSTAQNDSVLVAHWLDSATFQPQRSNHFLRLVNRKETNADKELLFDILTLKTKYFIKVGDFKQATMQVRKGKRLFRDELEAKTDFISLEGSVYAIQREFTKAITCYKNAIRNYDQLQLELKSAYVQNNIANVFFNLNDFESAYNYAKSSFKVVFAQKDTVRYPQIAGILAISEVKTNRMKLANFHAYVAVLDGGKYANPVAKIIGLYALGDYYAARKEYARATQMYQKVISLSKPLNLVSFENFGHLGLLAVFVETQQFELAIKEGEWVLNYTSATKQHTTDYALYNNLSKAYAGIGQNDKAYYYLAQANEMFRTYSSNENKKAIQELLVKYESEKKAKTIAKQQLQLSSVWNALLLLFVVLLVVVLFIIRIRRKNKARLQILQLENEHQLLEAFVEGEQKERERLAADIHDGIASSLTGLYLKVQQNETINDTRLIAEQIQQLRNEVRTISKNITPFNLEEEGWIQSFQRVIQQVQSETFRVFLIPNFREELLNSQRGMIVYRILQEMIQNTLKHAQATECEIVMVEEQHELLIQYSDNGIGVNAADLMKGNGWHSMKKRISALNGTISLPPNPMNGFKIDIKIPQV